MSFEDDLMLVTYFHNLHKYQGLFQILFRYRDAFKISAPKQGKYSFCVSTLVPMCITDMLTKERFFF